MSQIQQWIAQKCKYKGEEDWHLKKNVLKQNKKTLVQGKQNYEGWVPLSFWKGFGQKKFGI